MERRALQEGTAMAMQRYELEAWLGDDHGLDEDQIDELLRTADEIEEQYPDEDDRDDREAALTAAYRLMVEAPEDLVAELAAERTAARIAEHKALVSLRQVAVTRIGNGDATEAGFAQQAGIDRMTVRKWTQDQKDRALLDRALFELVRSHGMPAEEQNRLSEAVGIRDTSGQAAVLLVALDTHNVEFLSEEARALVARAEKRARQIV
jgi:DNA-binding transcriptional regulator YiaG